MMVWASDKSSLTERGESTREPENPECDRTLARARESLRTRERDGKERKK